MARLPSGLQAESPDLIPSERHAYPFALVSAARTETYALDLSDAEEKSSDVLHLFEKAAANTPALEPQREVEYAGS